MRNVHWRLALLLAVSLMPLHAQAAAKKSQAAKAVVSAPVVEALPVPGDVADAFHEALRLRDKEKAMTLLSSDALLFETGYVETSRDDYMQKNFVADADFASVTDYRLLRRNEITDGQTAWVFSQSSISGIFGDQRVDLIQAETMILRRAKVGWEIVHLHWSAHPRDTRDTPQDALSVPPEVMSPSPAAATTPGQTEAKPEVIHTP